MDYAPLTDAQLLGRFIDDRDEEAFRRIVDRHLPMVTRICTRLTGEWSAGEEATQQVFVYLAKRAKDLQHRPSLAGWLHRTATYTALRARRDAQTRAHHEYQAAYLYTYCTPNGESEDLQENLNRAITALPDEYRDALVLHHLHGYTVEQTAELLESRVGTVASRLSRGREMLRARLALIGVALPLPDLIALLESTETNTQPLLAANLNQINYTGLATPASAVPGGAALAATGAMAGPAILPKIAAMLFLMSGASVAGAAVGGFFSRPPAPTPTTAAEIIAANSKPGAQPSSSAGGSFGSAVPEPSTLGLLAIGSLTLLRRRRSAR